MAWTLFKKRLELAMVVADLVVMLDKMEKGFEPIASESGLSVHPRYRREAATFAYIGGFLSTVNKEYRFVYAPGPS